MAARTYTGATRKFLGSLGEVSDQEEPLVMGLRSMARELDKQYQAATYTQYRRTINDLLKMRGDGGPEKDPLEELLDDRS